MQRSTSYRKRFPSWKFVLFMAFSAVYSLLLKNSFHDLLNNRKNSLTFEAKQEEIKLCITI